MSNRQIETAKRLVRQWTRDLGQRTGWLGIAPSYLASAMDISYHAAAGLLIDLEARGFIYDNGHGNHTLLPDGREYATRYYMKEL